MRQVHREINVIEASITNMKNQYLNMMKYIHDRFNLMFDLACEADADFRKVAKHEMCRPCTQKCKWHVAVETGQVEIIKPRRAKRIIKIRNNLSNLHLVV